MLDQTYFNKLVYYCLMCSVFIIYARKCKILEVSDISDRTFFMFLHSGSKLLSFIRQVSSGFEMFIQKNYHFHRPMFFKFSLFQKYHDKENNVHFCFVSHIFIAMKYIPIASMHSSQRLVAVGSRLNCTRSCTSISCVMAIFVFLSQEQITFFCTAQQQYTIFPIWFL